MALAKDVETINVATKFEAYEEVRRGWWWLDYKIDRPFSLWGRRRTRASEKARQVRGNVKGWMRKIRRVLDCDYDYVGSTKNEAVGDGAVNRTTL
jgi:hypothetical protein